MEIEVLDKKHKKKIVIIITFIVLALIVILCSVSLAKYRSSKSINIAKGTVNYKQADLNLVSVYLEDENDNTYKPVSDGKIPTSGYTLNEDITKTRCEIKGVADTNITITYENGEASFSKLTTTGTKCYLYFDKAITASTLITGGTTTTDSIFAGITGDGVYTWTKGDYSGGDQPIKYFRGNVDNNWVVFGKDGSNYIWWRIIRNNSNGSLRMIYAGVSSSKTSAPATIGEGTQIGTRAFNSKDDDNMYVGFKYTSGQVHGTGTNASILGAENSTDVTMLYGWYNTKLKTNYGSYIDTNAGFCNDRTPYSGSGTGTTVTNYGVYTRLKTNKAPSLLCSSTDVFKTPLGLITADEVQMGGIVYSSPSNTNSYLSTTKAYWTMSPSSFSGSVTYMLYVNYDSTLYGTSVNNSSNGVRPVINLKADTVFEQGGQGTSNSPFVVQGT